MQSQTSQGSCVAPACGFSSPRVELEKPSSWLESPPPFTHESRMNFFKLSPSLEGHIEEMMPTGQFKFPPLPS